MYYSSIKSVDVQLEEISSVVAPKKKHTFQSCLFRIVIGINFPSRTDNSQTNT